MRKVRKKKVRKVPPMNLAYRAAARRVHLSFEAFLYQHGPTCSLDPGTREEAMKCLQEEMAKRGLLQETKASAS